MSLARVVGAQFDREIDACRLYHHGERKTAAAFAWCSLQSAIAWRKMSFALILPEYRMQCRARMRSHAQEFRRWASQV